MFGNEQLDHLVASVVAVEARALFDALKRPRNVDDSAEAMLGVAAVSKSAESTLACLGAILALVLVVFMLVDERIPVAVKRIRRI